MASAAEQLAANVNLSAFGKAEELKQRIWFTLAALVVYRLGTYIPLPGIDPDAFAKSFFGQSKGVLELFNMFAGGAVQRRAIFALNIMPYISASIIIQLLTSVVPALESVKKDGESGRKVLNQYTRYLTVVLATFQAYGMAIGLEGQTGVVTDPGLFFRLSTVVTLVGGTMFLMWLGEQITSRGIGNGSSLIIFAGIVAAFPSAIVSTLELGRQGAISTGVILGVIAMSFAVIAFIVFMERAQRRLLITYPKRQHGNRVYEGQSSFLPLKLNTSGVIPPIFASSLLLLPTTIANFYQTQGTDNIFATISAYFGHGRPLYMLSYIGLIVFFAYKCSQKRPRLRALFLLFDREQPRPPSKSPLLFALFAEKRETRLYFFSGYKSAARGCEASEQHFLAIGNVRGRVPDASRQLGQKT